MKKGEDIRKIKLFICSREKELKEERIEIKTELENYNVKINIEPIHSEAFSAKPENKQHLDQLEKCDLAMVVFKNGISQPVVEEITTSLERNIPLYVYILKDEIANDDLKPILDEIKNLVWYKRISKKDIKNIARQTVFNELDVSLSSPEFFKDIPSMYDHSIKIIRDTKVKLYIVQRTPSLLFTPIPKNREKEEAFIKSLNSWIDRKIIKKDYFLYKPKCTILFSLEHTKDEIKNIMSSPSKYKDFLKKYIMLKDLEIQSKYQFRIISSPIRKSFTNPFILGDNHLGIWFMVGIDIDLGLSMIDRNISTEWISKIEDWIIRKGQVKNDCEIIIDGLKELEIWKYNLNFNSKFHKKVYRRLSQEGNLLVDMDHYRRVHCLGMIIGFYEGKIDDQVMDLSLLFHGFIDEIGKDKLDQDRLFEVINHLMDQKKISDEIKENVINCLSEYYSMNGVGSQFFESKILSDASLCDDFGISRIDSVKQENSDDNNRAAKSHLSYIIQSIEEKRVFSSLGKLIINRRLKFSLKWCKEVLNEDFNKILKRNNIKEEDIKF